MTTYVKSPSSSSSSSPKKSAFARLCRKLSPARKPSLELQVQVESNNTEDEQLRRVFNYFDEDGNGKISPAELRSCVASTGGHLSAEEAEAAVACLDMDGDGHLGYDEFCSLMETTHESEQDKAKELREAFGMYAVNNDTMKDKDKDKDKHMLCITPASLRTMLGRLGLCDSRSLDDCKAMIRAFDLNGDGVLTFDEFTLMMR